VTEYCCDWIRKLVRRYNNQGAAGLADRRCDYPGAPPLLDDLEQVLYERCRELLKQPELIRRIGKDGKRIIGR
jgi:hypothetical protein